MRTFSKLKYFTIFCLSAFILLVANIADVQAGTILFVNANTGEDQEFQIGDEVSATFVAQNAERTPAVNAQLRITHAGLRNASHTNNSTAKTATSGEETGTVTVTGTITGGQEVYIQAEWLTEKKIARADFNIIPSSTPTSNAVVHLSPATVTVIPENITNNKELTFKLEILNGENVAGYQATVQFDTTALEYVRSSNNDYLLTEAADDVFFIKPVEDNSGSVTVAAASQVGENSGNGTLATITFKVLAVKDSTVTLINVLLTDRAGDEGFSPEIGNAKITGPIPEDINEDGVVNIHDLTLVGSNFGQTGKNPADVNEDEVVNIQDLVLVAGSFGNTATTAGAPFALAHDSEIALTRANIKTWLQEAQQLKLTDPDSLRGIAVLEQLLTALTPEKTTLFPNFPNPFNPETWIPYQLATPADVSVSIYATNGQLIRKLDLGHQAAGLYRNKSRAAYWDGKNEFGEQVASGLYFYTLTAGKFSATGKMLILK